MGELKKAYMEIMEDDMGMMDGNLSHPAQLVRDMMEHDKEKSVEELVQLGWGIFELDSSIQHLIDYKGDLSLIARDIEISIERLKRVHKKALDGLDSSKGAK